ncbi:MAG: hypothetical protein OEM52_07600 [bacterium]|nr:hypothetical protein [bacterium]
MNISPRMFVALLVCFICYSFALAINTPPIRIDGIQIVGNDITKDDVILREIMILPGSWVDSADIVEAELRITNLNLFHRVECFPIIRNDSTILAIAVTEKWYIFPLPYANWVGPNPGDFEYGFRYAQDNFRGWNRFLVATAWSGSRTGIQGMIYDPWIRGTPGLGALAQIQYEEWKEEVDGEPVEDRRRLMTILGIFKRFGTEITLRTFVGGHRWLLDSSDAITRNGNDHWYTSRFEYQRDRRDLIELPHRGDYILLWFEMNRSADVWINRYVTGVDARQYLPLAKRWTLSAGIIAIGSDGLDPEYMRLRLGNTIPMRGYRDLSIPGGFIAKGGMDLRWNVLPIHYYTWRTAPKWLAKHTRNWKYGASVSLFQEIGQSWEKNAPLQSRRLLNGYGAAVSFSLPYVNVLRFDLGFNPEDGFSEPAFRAWLTAAY